MPSTRLDALFGAAVSFYRRDPRPDGELLARFLSDGDETAFEVLLVRHTPAVRAACRGWLRRSADIDDAAQATFLVLVQRARSIRDHQALGRWLYRVADRVARRLRRQLVLSCPVPENLPGREPAAYDDVRDLLAEEVARLPEKYRLPVQLCYTAGLTTAEAAERLGWPRGTVLTRLAWARKRLRKGLTRRGVGPVVLAGLAIVPATTDAHWLRATARAAQNLRAGAALAQVGIAQRTITLTEGVVRTMMWNKLKYIALVALLAVGLAGYGLGQWVSAADGPENSRRSLAAAGQPRAARDKDAADPPAGGEKSAAKADEVRPSTPGRRREAVIRLPLGTFVKEIDVAPYGSGRLTWTYEEERILGLIEVTAMGGELELATEAEYSLSSNGTIYGLITGVRLNHVRLPDGEQFAELKPFAGLWPVVEPLIDEMLIDLPFSYQFRVQGDRLVISNYRILLAGPNPLGKLGGVFAGQNGNDNAFFVLAGFQALGTAIEGTYTAPDAKDKPAPSRPLFPKLRGRGVTKTTK
jgi:RNA polymerase sigma factor (sigma-70 family)